MKNETEIRRQYALLSKDLQEIQKQRATAMMRNNDTQDRICVQKMLQIKNKIEMLDWVLNNANIFNE